jgi:hypothetical protein
MVEDQTHVGMTFFTQNNPLNFLSLADVSWDTLHAHEVTVQNFIWHYINLFWRNDNTGYNCIILNITWQILYLF